VTATPPAAAIATAATGVATSVVSPKKRGRATVPPEVRKAELVAKLQRCGFTAKELVPGYYRESRGIADKLVRALLSLLVFCLFPTQFLTFAFQNSTHFRTKLSAFLSTPAAAEPPCSLTSLSELFGMTRQTLRDWRERSQVHAKVSLSSSLRRRPSRDAAAGQASNWASEGLEEQEEQEKEDESDGDQPGENNMPGAGESPLVSTQQVSTSTAAATAPGETPPRISYYVFESGDDEEDQAQAEPEEEETELGAIGKSPRIRAPSRAAAAKAAASSRQQVNGSQAAE
jgi:hypothetical protein